MRPILWTAPLSGVVAFGITWAVTHSSATQPAVPHVTDVLPRRVGLGLNVGISSAGASRPSATRQSGDALGAEYVKHTDRERRSVNRDTPLANTPFPSSDCRKALARWLDWNGGLLEDINVLRRSGTLESIYAKSDHRGLRYQLLASENPLGDWVRTLDEYQKLDLPLEDKRKALAVAAIAWASNEGDTPIFSWLEEQPPGEHLDYVNAALAEKIAASDGRRAQFFATQIRDPNLRKATEMQVISTTQRSP